MKAVVFIKSWGDDKKLVELLKSGKNVVSVFHIMSNDSYIVDAFFNHKIELENWINELKSVKLENKIPALLSIRTLQVIEIIKQKGNYSIEDYKKNIHNHHIFLRINTTGNDEELHLTLKRLSEVTNIVHVLGDASYIIELMTSDKQTILDIINSIKILKNVISMETQEVISVIKYRNQIIFDNNIKEIEGEDNYSL